jgi:pimeloyl-ACP methyl ester carboxylesterase
MQQSNSQEWRLAGGRLAAQVWGPDTASTTWLALHGWADNAATFARLAPDLTDTLNLRIVALDFSGHGHSAHRPPRSEYALWSYSHDALDALDALGLTRVTLLGHSLGAGVANLLAATYPERVQALVLIDGLLGRLATTAGLVGQLRRGLSDQRRPPSEPPRYRSVEQAVQVRVSKSLLPIDADTARPIVLRNLDGCDRTGYRLRLDRQVMAARPMAFTEAQAVAVLAAIRCPALLLQGRNGIIPERDPRGVCRAAIPGLTQITLDGGHHLHLAPATCAPVAQAIARWYG